MNGLALHTAKVFEDLSKLTCIKNYCLIGGTALSLQLYHRLSEDLDFCLWKTREKEKMSVDWSGIEQELSQLGTITKNLLDHNQCDFILKGVRISFYANNIAKEPAGMIKHDFLNNIKLADITSIGIMKLEVMSRRCSFRDYYDIYSILKSGIPLKDLIVGAGKFSRHKLKTRDMLIMLTKGKNFTVDHNFAALQPIYSVTNQDIESYLVEEIKKMNGKYF
jgi:hypothetical protein